MKYHKWKSHEIGWFFHEFAPENSAKFWFLPAKYQKPCKLIDKVSLGAAGLKVEGPIMKKGSFALEVTMANNHPALLHWQSSVEHLPLSYLTIQGTEEWEQKPADFTGCVSQWSTKIRTAKESWDMQSHVSLCIPSSHHAQACLPGAQLLTR